MNSIFLVTGVCLIILHVVFSDERTGEFDNVGKELSPPVNLGYYGGEQLKMIIHLKNKTPGVDGVFNIKSKSGGMELQETMSRTGQIDFIFNRPLIFLTIRIDLELRTNTGSCSKPTRIMEGNLVDSWDSKTKYKHSSNCIEEVCKIVVDVKQYCGDAESNSVPALSQSISLLIILLLVILITYVK